MDFLILTSAVRARLKHIGSICKGQEKSGRDFLIGAFTYYCCFSLSQEIEDYRLKLFRT